MEAQAEAKAQDQQRPVHRVRRRARPWAAVLLMFGVLLVLHVPLHRPIVPTQTPFPMKYLSVSDEGASLDFRADGTVSAKELPVWQGEKCTGPAALVTGDGRWYQDWNFQFWVEIDGQRAKWSPHNYRGSLDWQEILIPVCGEYIEKTQRVFRADHFPP